MARIVALVAAFGSLLACGGAAGGPAGAHGPDAARVVADLLEARRLHALDGVRRGAEIHRLAAIVAIADESDRRTAAYDVASEIAAELGHDERWGRPGLVAVASLEAVIARNADRNRMLGERLAHPLLARAVSGEEAAGLVSIDEAGQPVDGWAHVGMLAAVPFRDPSGAAVGVLFGTWPLAPEADADAAGADLVLLHGAGTTSSLPADATAAVVAAVGSRGGAAPEDLRIELDGIAREASVGPVDGTPVRWVFLPRPAS